MEPVLGRGVNVGGRIDPCGTHGVRDAIREGLDLIGVSSPDSM